MTALLEPISITDDLKAQAYKEKDRAPYVVALGDRHRAILKALASAPHEGMTDAEIVFGLRIHQAGARRCELRDIGAVRRSGRRNKSYAWKITDRGRELLARLEKLEVPA